MYFINLSIHKKYLYYFIIYRYHESILTMSNTPIEDFANGRINPTYRCVQNWHDQWRVLNLGPRTGQGVIMVIKYLCLIIYIKNLFYVYIIIIDVF